MKQLAVCALVIGLAAPELIGQGLSAPALSSPMPDKRVASKDASKPKKEKDDDSPMKHLMGGSDLPKDQPIITEIYADEAFFDSANHLGIFTGHVIVNDPRFNVQSDKLTIYLSKSSTQDEPPSDEKPAVENSAAPASPKQALEKAVAEGNVGVVRERPGENGGPPVRSVGRGEMAIYTTSDGNVELRGMPRVQSGLDTHVATSPDTVMLIQGNGQLITKGPSRTEIRQEPKVAPTPPVPGAPAAAASPAAKPKP